MTEIDLSMADRNYTAAGPVEKHGIFLDLAAEVAALRKRIVGIEGASQYWMDEALAARTDARLVPDLLAALEGMLAWNCDSDTETITKACNAARAAIAKVRGE